MKFTISQARFNFVGNFGSFVFSIPESSAEDFKMLKELEQKIGKAYKTYNPVMSKDFEGKNYISLNVRGCNTLTAKQKGNIYTLELRTYEATAREAKYLNLYLDKIKLHTAKVMDKGREVDL
jgi:hypothetical protein